MTYLDFLEQKVLLERLVIGLEEPVLIKGLGELSAKIDSGNGGYNVIHGTDFHQQGNELLFTTHDDKGNEKKIQAKVIDTIEINMGGGNIENRPVIELDIKFAGEDYKKIPFSVSDRSTNTNPILISKGFVENELKALIDVSATNISNDGIDVVYGESIEGKADQAAKKWDDSKAKKGLKMGITAGKAGVEAGKSVAKGTWGALKTLGRGAMGAADWLKGGEDKSLLEPVYGAANMAKDIAKGVGGAIAALGGRFVWKKICDGAKSIVHAEEILVTDKNAIRSKLSNTAIPQNLSNQTDADIDSTIIPSWNEVDLKTIPIIPVTSFMCNKGDNFDDVISGLEQKRKLWKKAIKQAKRAVPEMRSDEKQSILQDNEAEEQEETLFEFLTVLENSLILEDAEQQLEQTQNATENSETQNNNTTSTTSNQNGEVDGEMDNITTEEVKQVQTDFEDLMNFTLWFVPIKNNSSTINDEIAEIDKELKPLQAKYKELIDKGQPLAFGQENDKKLKELEEKKKKIEANNDTNTKTVSKSSVNAVTKIIQSSDSILMKLFSLGSVESSKFEPILTNLAKSIQQQGEQGFFVMGYSVDENKRNYQFFEKLNTIAYTRRKQEVQDDSEIENSEKQQESEDANSETTNSEEESSQKSSEETKSPQFDETENNIIQNNGIQDEENEKGIETDVQEEQPQNDNKSVENIQDYETDTEAVEEPSSQTHVSSENPDTEEVHDTEAKETSKNTNNQIRVKTRAQMNAHARANKKAHMYKGKKKGTESEEEPFAENEEDPWIKEKLRLFKSKGLI